MFKKMNQKNMNFKKMCANLKIFMDTNSVHEFEKRFTNLNIHRLYFFMKFKIFINFKNVHQFERIVVILND